MAADIQTFRASYRAAIHPWYRVWLHVGVIAAYALLCLTFFASQLHRLAGLEWLAVPLTIVLANFGEYFLHKYLGHRPQRIAPLFYHRHTVEHHHFFDEQHMVFETARDWRVIVFPPYAIVLLSVALWLGWGLLRHLNANGAALFALTGLGSYLMYEFFHAVAHLADDNPLKRLPWLHQMGRLHQLHHRRKLMGARNFNLWLPLADWLCGTLYWDAGATARSAEEASVK